MKSLRSFIISTLALIATNEALACWEHWQSPDEHFMYRVYEEPPKAIPQMKIGEIFPDIEANCIGWQKLTSDAIPLGDIYKVVYKMPLEDFEKICNNRRDKYENKFVEWITKRDSAILDFLLLAKTNEHIRIKLNSRWYYPTMKIGSKITLEEIAERALSAKSKKLRDRYLLQAVRALFSLTRYEECVALWDNEVSKLPADNLMRKLIQPYIAGAEFRLKNTAKAIEYYIQIGDIYSVLYCANRTSGKLLFTDAIDIVYKYAPKSPYIPQALQASIRSIEEGSPANPDKATFRQFCIEKAALNRDDNAAMWYYTAAFLSDSMNETEKAAQLLALAEKSRPNKFIGESIKVFRMYIDAKTSSYNSAYEAKLFEQLKWLDAKISSNIDDDVRSLVADEFSLKSNISFYYWNDMLRRILLTEVCPRMVKAGKKTRALQLANMADNRLIGLVNSCNYHRLIPTSKTADYKFIKGETISKYRYDTYAFNGHDYSNHFFELIDSLGANPAKKYLQNIGTPTSAFDHFLNLRGYTDKNYLNDIVGTQCLREMRYGEAESYLANVSKAYNNGHLNTALIHDPFSIGRKGLSKDCNTRYEFARKMHSLEQTIATTNDPNVKAESMFRYATGLRNSFDRCWALTQYYRGSTYWGCVVAKKRNWEEDKYTKAAKLRAKEYTDLACATATNEEVLANIHYELHLFKTTAQKFPNTEKGRLVHGKCDRLVDYKVVK